jgi:hypothetical protein
LSDGTDAGETDEIGVCSEVAEMRRFDSCEGIKNDNLRQRVAIDKGVASPRMQQDGTK